LVSIVLLPITATSDASEDFFTTAPCDIWSHLGYRCSGIIYTSV